MPKVTIVFDLPEETTEHSDAINGWKWRGIVYDLSLVLRNDIKHGHQYKSADEALEAIKQELWTLCKENNLDPWEN